MWYRFAINLPDLWNFDVKNDPKSIKDALEGVVFDSKKRTNNPKDILNNLNTYKKVLLDKFSNNKSIIEENYQLVYDNLVSEYPELGNQEQYSGDWMEEAFSWIGTPYKFGGDDKNGIDCSAFIQKVFPELNLPRVASDQQNVGTSISTDNPSQWQAGDRLYFDMTSRKGFGQGVADHTGIYLGDSQFIQASSSKGVTVTNLNDYYLDHLISVMR